MIMRKFCKKQGIFPKAAEVKSQHWTLTYQQGNFIECTLTYISLRKMTNVIWYGKYLKMTSFCTLFFDSSAYSNVYLPFTYIMCLYRCYRYGSQKSLLYTIFFHLLYIVIMNASYKMCLNYGNLSLVICTSSKNFGLLLLLLF